MLDLQLEAAADALGAILAQQRREWSLEHAAFIAEHKALLAELRRENAELRAELKAAADEQRGRVDAALASVKDGEPGPTGPPGESQPGPQGERGVGIAAIVRDGSRLSVELEDGRVFDAGDVAGERGEPGPPGESMPGPKGDPGESIAGAKGDPGANGVGIAAIEREGARLVFELDDGRRFDVGEIVGPKGDPGEQGIGVAGALIDRDGCLVVTMSNGTSQNLGAVVGRDGKDGQAGAAGLGFDDLDILHDGERGFTFRLAREGSEPKSWTYSVPAQIYRGVHVDGAQHERGDTVTWGGSLYHCNEPTTDKPGAGSPAWTLAVKRGQDGKDGKPGAKGDPGPTGRPGKDLTQMDETGRKW